MDLPLYLTHNGKLCRTCILCILHYVAKNNKVIFDNKLEMYTD